MISLIALFLGFLLDLLLGDPHWLPHPVRGFGWLIARGERLLRRILPANPRGELMGGTLLVIVICLIAVTVPWLLLWAAEQISVVWRLLIETIMCYQILATKALKTESMKVYDALVEDDLPKARQMVAMIVGRDTAELSATQVTKAAVETVAENTSDGVVAPCLFLALGGAPLGFFYKAVNTMDSMIGYKNTSYLYFGRVAAKLDDLLNYLPARLAALLMLVSAAVLGRDYRHGWRIYRRDRYQHTSPNSAHTEAVCAGVLGVKLAGDAYYFGQLHHKPTIGDADRLIEPEDIKRANQLLYGTAITCMLLCVGAKALFIGLWGGY